MPKLTRNARFKQSRQSGRKGFVISYYHDEEGGLCSCVDFPGGTFCEETYFAALDALQNEWMGVDGQIEHPVPGAPIFPDEASWQAWRDKLHAPDEEPVEPKEDIAEQQQNDTQPVEAYARLPRSFCEAPGQVYKPFDIGVLGAVLMHAKSGKAKIARRDLLRMAGAGWGSSQLERLDAALDVLLRTQVGKLPPPLVAVDADGNKPLKLEVHAAWLPASHYVKVPWPPPKDALACSLYLWLVARNPRRNDPRGCSFESLLGNLGYNRDHPVRDVRAALQAVNAHCARHEFTSYGMQINDGTVRFSRTGVATAAKWCRQRRKVVS